MLDKSIWTEKFIGSESNAKVDYVIGCPTIEQMARVNNKKHPESKLELQATTAGYQLKTSGTDGWVDSTGGVFNPNDSELVQKDTNKSTYMWIASPSAHGGNYILRLDCNGGVPYTYYYSVESGNGFRPLISLESGAQLKATETGYIIQ